MNEKFKETMPDLVPRKNTGESATGQLLSVTYHILPYLIIWTPYNGMPRFLGFVHYGQGTSTYSAMDSRVKAQLQDKRPFGVWVKAMKSTILFR